ncbi:MAG: hypothetical protein NTX65_02535 [Ignavibacteriales bacterium]|nr:hypothetical protein [Ignavibacteriales bacterium]
MADDQQIPPDNLKLKEADDSKFVTEEIGAMRPIFHRLLTGWNIVTGIAAIVIAIAIWPTEPIKNTSVSNVPKDSTNVAVAVPDSLTKKVITDSSKQVTVTKVVSSKIESSELGIKLLILSLLFGILGGATHGLSSLMDFRGQRRLFRSWSLWYFGRPILGGMVSMIFYLVVRAGLFSSSASSIDANLYGIAAISTLVGMFTDQATNKLSELFKTMFVTKGEEREGKLTPDAPKPEDENKS